MSLNLASILSVRIRQESRSGCGIEFITFYYALFHKKNKYLYAVVADRPLHTDESLTMYH